MTDTTAGSGGAIRETITVPREIVNADTVLLVRWELADGAPVQAGVVVCEIDTSKAAVSVEATESGFLRHRAAVGADVPVGGVLGYIMADATSKPSAAEKPAPAATSGTVNISAKARRKIEELGLDLALFAGLAMVREEDVLAVAARQRDAAPEQDPRGAYRVEALGPVQRRVARSMEQVVSVPVSYLERSVDLDAVKERAKAMTAEAKVIVSVVDLLVWAVGRAATQFGRFNSWFVSETDVRTFEHAHVGVAVDIENDLYVVVVRDTDTKDVRTVASDLRKVQYLAQRRRLDVSHLTGGTITVSSMIGRGVHRFQPLLFPQQSAIVGITDAESDGRARLTLGFDHRVANGSQAAAFLAAIDEAFTP